MWRVRINLTGSDRRMFSWQNMIHRGMHGSESSWQSREVACITGIGQQDQGRSRAVGNLEAKKIRDLNMQA